jgi:hypothetical protein
MYLVYADKSIAAFIFFLLRKTGIGSGKIFNFTINNQGVKEKIGVEITRRDFFSLTDFLYKGV